MLKENSEELNQNSNETNNKRIEKYENCDKEEIINLYLNANDELFDVNYHYTNLQATLQKDKIAPLENELKPIKQFNFYISLILIITYIIIITHYTIKFIKSKSHIKEINSLTKNIENMSINELKTALTEDKKLYNKFTLNIINKTFNKKIKNFYKN